MRTARRAIARRTNLQCERLEARNLLAANLVAHWQAQELVASNADGAVIEDWTDAIGGIVASNDGQPVLSHTALGGKAGLNFNPDDGADWFLVSSQKNPVSGLNDFSAAVVFSTSSVDLLGANGPWYENTAIVDASSLGFANGWGLSISSSGQVATGLGGGFGNAATSVYSNMDGFNDGQTHLAIINRSGTNMSLQIDDNPAVVNVGNSMALSSIDIAIGGQKRGQNAFDGYIAELRLFSGSLDAAQVTSLYAEFISTYNNQAPTAVNDSFTLTEDASFFAVTPGNGVLTNDVDLEGDPIKALLVQDAQHGRLSLSNDGSFIYIPEKDFFGADTFTYSAVDFRPSAPATVTLNVTGVYDGAKPTADQYKTTPAGILNVGVNSGLLANDLNPDRETLTVQLARNVGDGTLNLNTDGSFTFDPRGFAGVATFDYQINDGTRLSAATTVTIISNTPPTSVDDSYTVDEDILLAVTAANGLLRNDSDFDGNNLSVEIVNAPQFGTLGLAANGSFTYLANANYNGNDEFTYRVLDGVDFSAVASVRITVNSINDKPIGRPDSYFTLPDTALRVPFDRGLLANDTDVDGPNLTAVLVNSPANGILRLSNDGSFTYTPNAGFVGDDSFTYRAHDSIDQSAPVRVEISVSRRPVVISELNAANASGLETKIRRSVDDSFPRDAITPDWIELRNLVSAPLDVGGMHLTDDPDDATKWAFPAGTTIAPEGYLVVMASGENIRDTRLDENGYLHVNFGLDANGDYLAITSADGTVVHELSPSYPPQVTNISFGSVGDVFRYFDSPTPGAANVGGLIGLVEDTSFSVHRGYYTEPFSVLVTTATPGATLVYTTDGKNPSMSEGTQVAPASGDLPPELTLNIDKSTTLRVAAFKDGFVQTNIDTQTYFFVEDIVEQSGLWSTVTDDPKWAPQLRDSFLSLPTISLVMDGRISTARETGTSVEMIFPDGSEEGFQIDAGVEHYGGHSINSPKKNMRLSFKTLYGESKLKYDLFGEGAVDEFDRILLRTGSHDNWFWVHPGGGRGNYIRNRWAFDRQIEMGHVAPHGRYVQVFINGEYWGMHQLMERPDASFMASYLGGSADDYDALNAGTPIDGDSDAWRALQSEAVLGDYDELQKHLDVKNYADYMLLQFYGGNDWDWNTSQNWAAARKREDGAGYVFFSWDSDVMLRTTATANVISRGGPGNLWNIRGGVKQHEEFLMLMADRAHEFFFNDGMLTSERLRHDFDAIADQIRLPVIAETARWGQQGFNGLRYTPDIWEGAVDWVKDTFASDGNNDRTATTISQLRRADVYPAIDAPEFTVNGNRQHGGSMNSSDLLNFVAADGIVYYTLDGSDPRLPGGTLNPDALVHDGTPIRLDRTVVLKSRAFTDEWSALSKAEFVVDTIPADASNLRITEVNYHPSNPTETELASGYRDGDDFEFIELFNLSQQSIDLSDARLQVTLVEGVEQGVEFNFGSGSITRLGPGEHLLVVEDIAAFQARYGSELPVAGQWSGGLSNRAEQITLSVADTIIHQFTYQDDWHPGTDGLDRTLQVVDPEQALDLWTVKSGWRASSERGGSPGFTGQSSEDLPGDSNRDGIFNSSDLVLVFQAGEFEDDIAGNSTWEEGDWNGDGDFTTRDLVAAFQLGHYSAAAVPLNARGDREQLAGAVQWNDVAVHQDGKDSRQDLTKHERHQRRAADLDNVTRDLIFKSF